GIADHFQLRTVFCDGPVALRYFGMLQARPFTPRQRRLYDHAAHLVGRRARFDHRLAEANGYRAALDRALDVLGRAAFVVDRHGSVVHANPIGTIAFDDARDDISAAIHGRSASYDAHAIGHARFLVLRRRGDLAQVPAALA